MPDLLVQLVFLGAPILVAAGAVLFAVLVGRDMSPDRFAQPRNDRR